MQFSVKRVKFTKSVMMKEEIFISVTMTTSIASHMKDKNSIFTHVTKKSKFRNKKTTGISSLSI